LDIPKESLRPARPTESTDQTHQIKEQASRSVKWAYLADLLPKCIQPLVLVVLANLLTPADYGIVGVSVAVVALAGMFQTMGLSQALIQRQDNLHEAANVAFWSNLTLGLLTAGLLVVMAPLLAGLFGDSRLINVLRLQSISVFVCSLGSVQYALLRRDFRFKRLTWLALTSSLCPLIVALPLAVAGAGYWALVLSYVVGRCLETILLWSFSPYRPSWKYDWHVARGLLVFGGWVAVEGLQSWGLLHGDNLVVAGFLGTERAGRYILSFNIVSLVIGMLVGPLSGVAYSAFSRLRGRVQEFRQAFLDCTRMLAAVVIPASLGLSVVTAALVPILGKKWSGIEPLLQTLAIMPGLGWIILLNPEVYKAWGRPDIMPKFHLATICYIVPAYLIAAQFGLKGFVLARASVGVVFYIPHIWVSVRVLKLPPSYFWNCIRSPLIAGLIMSAAVYLLLLRLGPYGLDLWYQQGGKLLALVALGVLVYAACLWIIDKNLCKRFAQLAYKFAR